MIFPALLLLLSSTAGLDQPENTPAPGPELRAIESRYDQTQLAGNEALREKYILELAALRWKLASHNKQGWQAVDAEIAQHPASANADSDVVSKLRVGVWHSPRHDYLFMADGTWTMDPEGTNADSTHGTWTIQGNSYSETVAITPPKSATYTIILLDADNFIYAEPGTARVYFETHTLHGGLPIRRDDSGQ
jgi:hypothetical protein